MIKMSEIRKAAKTMQTVPIFADADSVKLTEGELIRAFALARTALPALLELFSAMLQDGWGGVIRRHARKAGIEVDE